MAKRSVGRPNVYDKRIQPFLREITTLRLAGTDYETIAKLLKIATSSLYKHKAYIEELLEATKKGNNGLIEKIEASLYDMALGRVKVTKTKTLYDSEGNVRSREETVETLAPNPVAVIFSLTNLAPEKWKNKQTETVIPETEQDDEMGELDEK